MKNTVRFIILFWFQICFQNLNRTKIMDFISSGWYLRRKTPSFQAINLSLVITSSFFRFNQNEIDILNPCQKCNRLVFLLFKNDDLKKKSIFAILICLFVTHLGILKKTVFYRYLLNRLSKFKMNYIFLISTKNLSE